MNNYDLSSLCRDAFVLIQGSTKISYRDGSVWVAEDDEREHPLIPRLRAASIQSLIEDPPAPSGPEELMAALDRERQVTEAMRQFLARVQGLCETAGAPKSGTGGDLLAWLDARLTRE